VAGSPDGRDFFINEGTQLPHDPMGNRVYRLHISAEGRSVRLTPLSITPGQGVSDAVVSGLAVSPDGASLAATIWLPSSGFNQTGEIEIISLSSGATRTWITHSFGLAWQPSWSADGKTLSFLWWDHITTSAQGLPISWDSQVRLLDATGPGGDLLASQVIATGGGQLGQFMSAITTPDGKLIIVAAARNVPGPGGRDTARLRLVALAPRTGRVLAVYAAHQVRYRGVVQEGGADGSCAAFDVNATGSQSLVSCTRFGRLDNGAFTALPGPPVFGNVAW
jgi:Tol biopolymer transport system component